MADLLFDHAIVTFLYPSLTPLRLFGFTYLLISCLIGFDFNQTNKINMGSGGGSVGRAVTLDARGPRFESSHQQTFISDIYLYTVNCFEKPKIKEKRPRMAHF